MDEGEDEQSGDDSESEEEIGCQIDELHEEVDSLEQELKQMDEEPKKKITAHDLDHAFRSLGLPKTKKYLEYVIWETDENLDGAVDWDEFQLMFFRNMTDKTGLEPFELFNVVQFMTFDQDNKGYITEDDCMSTLFVRFGRNAVAREMEKLFGDKLKSKGGEGVLRLADYLAVAGVREVHMTEQRMGDLLKKVETLKPPKSTRGGSGIVEHEKKWKPM